MELRIYISQPKRYNIQGQEIFLHGNNPKNLAIQVGSLPQHRRLPIYANFTDVTQYASDLHKLKLTWTHDRNDQGVSVPGGFSQKKSASGRITFEGEAYRFLKKWLIDDESASLNSIGVQIKHVGCGDYTDWSIRSTDLTWCEGEECIFEISIKQKDEAIRCIKSTVITDNWQGWFGDTETPWSGKKHPRFSYCNEIRPNSMLVVIWYLLTQLMGAFISFLLAFIPTINMIILIIKGFVGLINLIIRFLRKIGFKTNEIEDDNLNYIEFKDIKEIFGHFFIESAGCGREHPAPLIRDYITNVCKKCGVQVNEDSIPIFFKEHMPIETSSDRQDGVPAQTRWNPHYNACYFHPSVQRGIRRYDKLNIFKEVVKNDDKWWLPGNGPILTLDMLLDQLKTVYNAEWRVVGDTLFFQRKDFWIDDDQKFDFSETGADRNLLLTGLCFEWDEVKSYAAAKGIYSPDGADTPGNEAMSQMNGFVSFGDTNINPNIEGMADKTTQFGATKFRLDGASPDYILDAMQQVINTQLISGAVWTTSLFATINSFFRTYANYALLLKQETITQPKILIWDGQHFEGLPKNARCLSQYHAHPNGGGMPNVNQRYNNNPTKQWHEAHEPLTRVSGGKLIPNSYTDGYYTVKGLFGALVTRMPAKLVNYPMYFAPGYKDSLWDWFHWIDDPSFNLSMHQKFTAKVELCCNTLGRIKPFGGGSDIILAQKVKLPNTFHEAYITEITVDYDLDEDLGPNIEIKGKL